MEPLISIVDDEALVRRAMGRLLRAEGYKIEAFESPSEFLSKADLSRPGCLIFDVAMPETDGLELQRELKSRGGAHPPIIFLTGRSDVPMAVRALKGGAVDFLTKPVDDAVLLSAIRQALTKDAAARAARSERDELNARRSTLTPRELEVMHLVAEGCLNKQIAAALGTVEKTIKVHRGRVMEKMKVKSAAELARLLERLDSSEK